MTFILKLLVVYVLASLFVNMVGWYVEDVIILRFSRPRITYQRLLNILSPTWLLELLADWWAQARDIIKDWRK